MNARVYKMCMRVCVRVVVYGVCNTSESSDSAVEPEVVHRVAAGAGDRRQGVTPTNAGERTSM